MTESRVLPGVSLGAGAEFDAIRRMVDRWGSRAQGIGDDAAVIAFADGHELVASVDATVEGVHFRPGWLTPREIGWRAAAAALSDLAAMGAAPLGMLFALTLPERWRDSLDELAEGVGDAASHAGAPILGGNISGGDALSLTITVLGTTPWALRRAAARPGDALYVTGRLGGPGQALRALLAGETPSASAGDRFAHPVPRIAEGQWLAAMGARAAIDISDGLHADAGHLAAASDATLVLEVESIPCVEGSAPPEALTSGEEYELLVAAPEGLDTAAFEDRFAIPLTRIGTVMAGGAQVVLAGGAQRVANAGGHDHLSS